MEAAPPPAPFSAAPAPSPVLTAWPRSAQLTTAFCLGLAAALLGVQGFGYLRSGARPTEQQQAAAPLYQVDLNEADRAELLQLPGVGEGLAARILTYRKDHHGFRSVDELARVRGVGPVTLERLRPWVCISPPEDRDDDPETPDVPAAAPPRKAPAPVPVKNGEAKKADKLKEPLDINRAGVEELKLLPGIGPKKAEAIVAERQKRPFRSVDDLRRVPGIGPKTLANLRPYVMVGEEKLQVAKEE